MPRSRPRWLQVLRRLRRIDAGPWGAVQPILQRELAYSLVTLFCGSVRIEVVNPGVLRWAMEPGRGLLFVCWHGSTALPLHFFRRRGIYALISPSRDGNLQASIFRRFGWQVIRGTSGHSGVRAIREAARVLRRGEKIGLTPDGPRGPRGRVQVGVAMMQRLARCPVVSVGVGHRRPYRLNTWDRYEIPRPGGKSVLYFAPPISADELSDGDVESVRQRIECELHQAQSLASRLAGG